MEVLFENRVWHSNSIFFFYFSAEYSLIRIKDKQWLILKGTIKMYKVNKRFYHVLDGCFLFYFKLAYWIFRLKKDKNVIVEVKVRLCRLLQWNWYTYFVVIVLGGAGLATFTLQKFPTADPGLT